MGTGKSAQKKREEARQKIEEAKESAMSELETLVAELEEKLEDKERELEHNQTLADLEGGTDEQLALKIEELKDDITGLKDELHEKRAEMNRVSDASAEILIGIQG